MTGFSSITIIYNPKSTGDSKTGAEELAQQLKKVLPQVPLALMPTKHAGHGEEIAYRLAKTRKKPLIISASGDGGYNDVVNGVMRVEKNTSVCAVLPTGNANDHSRVMHDKPLWELIEKRKITKIDLLKMTVTRPSKPKKIRYAHSYIGAGITPVVAAELNRHTLNAFKEMMLVLKTFFKYRPFKIHRNGKTMKFDSLIFTNINQMAKILTLSKKNKPADGLFEVIAFPHKKKLFLIHKLLQAATTGLPATRREKTYEFEVIKKMPVQLDGEVTVLDPGAKVRVEAATQALSTIV